MRKQNRPRPLVRVATAVTALVGFGLAPLAVNSTANAAGDLSTGGEQSGVSFNSWVPAGATWWDPDDAPTASKPQSKLWYAQGSWWGVLQNTSNNYYIYKFDSTTHKWTNTGVVVDSRHKSHLDVLWDGTNLYTVGAVDPPQSGGTADMAIKFSRFVYNAATSKYVAQVSNLPLNGGGVEAPVIAKDGKGRLWVAYTAPNAVGTTSVANVRYVTSDNFGTSWTSPTALTDPSSEGLNPDDIATVVGSSDGAAIVWSEQDVSTGPSDPKTEQESVHVATFSHTSNSWTFKTLAEGLYTADDHLNMSVDGDGAGRVFLVLKTGANDRTPNVQNSDPLIELWVRDTSGNWGAPKTVNTVGEGGTRPIVVIDKDANKLRVFLTDRETGGSVMEKTTPLDNPGTFSTAKPVLDLASDPHINNVTTTKQNVTVGNTGPELLILASDELTGHYVQNYSAGGRPGGGGTPTPSLTVPKVVMKSTGLSYASSRTVTASWRDAAGSDVAGTYNVVVNAIGTGRAPAWRRSVLQMGPKTYTSFTGAPGTTYCMQVRGQNMAGMGPLSGERCVSIPLDDRQLAKKGAWKKAFSKSAYLRTLLKTTARGASVTSTVTGKRVSLVVTKLPKGGKVSIYKGKRLVKRVSLNATRTRTKEYIPILKSTRVTTARYRVVVTSKGAPVLIDGLAVSRK
ncbi:MAG TPA: hypothetical protein VK204_02255 [Nocardioidaceae bacterium]|nr:hypothetical protein [Nocardioidaceae bacterium]